MLMLYYISTVTKVHTIKRGCKASTGLSIVPAFVSVWRAALLKWTGSKGLLPAIWSYDGVVGKNAYLNEEPKWWEIDDTKYYSRTLQLECGIFLKKIYMVILLWADPMVLNSTFLGGCKFTFSTDTSTF